MKLIMSLDRIEDSVWIAECPSIPSCLPHVFGGVSARGILKEQAPENIY
jgi:hypothetical protein